MLAEWSRSRGVVQLKLAGSFCVLIGLGIVSGISFVAGCNSPPRLTSQQAEGKHLYEIRCAHCHRENDLALKKVPPDLHSVFKRSTMPSGVAATDAEMRRVVLAGKGMMPAFAGRFTEEQMAALIAYGVVKGIVGSKVNARSSHRHRDVQPTIDKKAGRHTRVLVGLLANRRQRVFRHRNDVRGHLHHRARRRGAAARVGVPDTGGVPAASGRVGAAAGHAQAVHRTPDRLVRPP